MGALIAEQIVWVGVFQYCFVRVMCTIAALITQLLGRYCEHSINPKYGHFWYQILTAVSVTIAMFCLIQFYLQTRVDLAEHKPFLKVLCIKLVIFFSFWQQVCHQQLERWLNTDERLACHQFPGIAVRPTEADRQVECPRHLRWHTCRIDLCRDGFLRCHAHLCLLLETIRNNARL